MQRTGATCPPRSFVDMGDDRAKQENERVRRTITARIESELVPSGPARTSLKASGWVLNDYSSCFSMEWVEAERRVGVFVKIPKTEIDRRSVLPRIDGDRRLADSERQSLEYLRTHWDDAVAVTYVEPLAFYRDFNAIVTRRAYAHDFFLPFRRADIARKMAWAQPDDVAENVLSRLGTALRMFHSRARASEGDSDEPFSGAPLIDKIARIADDLDQYGVGRAVLHAPLVCLERWRSYSAAGVAVLTLKGLDVRNVLIADDRHVHLLDPGRLKRDFHQADLARMLVTCRILYWGTPWFALNVRPARVYDSVFLGSYYQRPPDDAIVLGLYVVKELFKHWRAAYVALTRKRWPGAIESLMGHVYIDAFYSRAVARELARFSS